MVPNTNQMSGVTGLRIKRNQAAAIPSFDQIVAGRQLAEDRAYRDKITGLQKKSVLNDAYQANRSFALAKDDAETGKKIQYGLLGLQGLNTADQLMDDGLAGAVGKGADVVKDVMTPDQGPFEFAKPGDMMASGGSAGIPGSSWMDTALQAGQDYVVDPIASGLKWAGDQAYDFLQDLGLFS